MYLHLGRDIVVRLQDIVGIFDLDNATIAQSTRDYLAGAEKEKRVINVTDELPKSFIVCREKGEKKEKVYISQISSQTLRKRTGFVENIANLQGEERP